jgi:hypothetical protein
MIEAGKIITCDNRPGEYSENKNVVIMWKIPFVKNTVCTPNATNIAALEPFLMPHIIIPMRRIMSICESR